MQERSSRGESACELRYHFVWCPKFRRPVLEGPVAERLDSLLRESCTALGLEVLGLEIMPDHVHLFVRADTPALAPAQIAYRLKGHSSHFLRREFRHLRSRLPTLWTRNYYVGTAGQVSAATIRRFVASQGSPRSGLRRVRRRTH